MTTVKMQQATIQEGIRLFEIMKKYGVHCSLELKVEEDAEPLMGIYDAPVSTDYIDSDNDGISFSVILGESEFSFNEKRDTFHRYVSECQIDLCISTDRYAAWFNSRVLPADAISEAKDHIISSDNERKHEELSAEESGLIACIRKLEFEDLLDAQNGIMMMVEKAENSAAKKFIVGDMRNAEGFKERADNLKELSELLGESNKDYRSHTHG